jgi:apolipoprotein N-acyltransferase
MSLRPIVPAAALSGALLAASHSFPRLELLAWIALIPLFFTLASASVIDGLFAGFIFGLVQFCGVLYWVAYAVNVYGGHSPAAALLVLLLLAAYLSVYPALFSAVSVFLRRSNPQLFFIAAPCAWVAVELVRSRMFGGFPWALAGYSQHQTIQIIQIADVCGVYGVSFLIVIVNAAAAEILLHINRNSMRGALIAVIILILALVYGNAKLDEPDKGRPLSVALVQGNIEQAKKWDPEYQTAVFDTYKRLTQSALHEHPDLVVWPETATPFSFNGREGRDGELTRELTGFIAQSKVSLLFGSPTYEVLPNHRLIAHNTAILLSSCGTGAASYDKVKRVPFGEYVPFKRQFFFLEKVAKTAGETEAGSDITVMKVEHQGGQKTAISAVICYEIIFPDFVRRFADNGAAVIASLTNDGWFGNTSMPYQHFGMAVFRAVENRVPVVRAANTGVSGFIDVHGRTTARTGIFTETYTVGSIRAGTEKTFYTKYGDIFSYGCALAVLVMLAAAGRRGTDARSTFSAEGPA